MIEIKPPWNNPNYLFKRLAIDFAEGRDYSPEEWKRDNMKYYLCGPIDTAGMKEQNIENFKKAAKYLRERGFDIVSCIESDIGTENYSELIRRDIRMLTDCDALILLPGWPQSKGARGELAIAMYLNMSIHYLVMQHNQLIDMNIGITTKGLSV